MSTPWCHDVVARAAPHVSLNDVTPSTGNTYGPPDSGGVPFCGGPPVQKTLPKGLPLGRGVVVTRASSGSATVVVAGSGVVAGARVGAVGVGTVTTGGRSGSAESVVSVTVVVVVVSVVGPRGGGGGGGVWV